MPGYSSPEIEARIEAFRVNASRTELNLAGVGVVASDLERLCASPDLATRLEEIDLSRTGLDDNAVEIIARFGGLRKLTAFQTSLGDAGVERLRGLQSLQELGLSGTRVTNEGLRHIAELRSLKRLFLSGAAIDDDGLERLGGLHSIEVLDLTKTRVTDKGLTHLGRMRSLMRLILRETAITDGGLVALENHRGLTLLNLVQTRIDGSGLKHVSGFPLIESLILRKTDVGGAGVKHIVELPSLRVLELEGTRIDDDDLAILTRLKGLRELNISFLPRLTREGFKHLAKLRLLRRLWLFNTPFDSDSMEVLANMTGLRELELDGSSIDDSGMKHLSALNALAFLSLGETAIGDAGLDHIASLSSLTTLILFDTAITNRGLSKLLKLKKLLDLDISSCDALSDITCLKALLPAAGGGLRSISLRGCPGVPQQMWPMTDAGEILGQLGDGAKGTRQSDKDAQLRKQITLLLRRHPEGLSAPAISDRLTETGTMEIESSTVRKKLKSWQEFKLVGSGRRQRFVVVSDDTANHADPEPDPPSTPQ